jgi:hypothetical protein
MVGQLNYHLAFMLAVVLLSALGFKFVSNSIETMSNDSLRWLMWIGAAVAVFMIDVPLLLFDVLGFAHP